MPNHKLSFSRHLCRVALCLAVVAGLTGCYSVAKPAEERRLSVLRPAPRDIKVVEITIPREKLTVALADKASFDALRVVEIFSSVTPGGESLPRYRIFGVLPGSVFQLLGLDNADILIGMNDRIIVDPNLFKLTVTYLPNEKKSEIEIVRGAAPILFKYTIEG